MKIKKPSFGMAFLYYKKLLRMDLAVLPRLAVRKDAIGELGEAGTARFFNL